jgi:hypothetical protein
MASNGQRIHEIDGVVYAIVSNKNGKAYIGSSWQWEQRVKGHVSKIINGNHEQKCIAEAFAGHALGDLTVKILQRVPLKVRQSGYTDRFGQQYWTHGHQDIMSKDALLEAEREWMRKYPNVVNKYAARLVLDIKVVDETPTPTPR